MRNTKQINRLRNGTAGITLIALVITIIVLLILAGISIMMLTGENSILNRAGQAKEGTVVGQEREAIAVAYNGVLANTQGAGVSAGDLQEELVSNGNNATTQASGKKIKVTFTDTEHVYIVGENGSVEEYTAAVDRTGIEVGDYIDYEPTDGTYSASKLGETYTGSSSNSSDLSTKVTTDGTTTNTVANWRVLRIYDDGRMDIIGDPTTYKVYFTKSRGYNNGPKVMNDICAALYSNSTHNITARSVDVDDFEVEGRGSWESAKSTYISNQISSLKSTFDTNVENGTTQYMQGVDTTNNTVTYVTESSYYPNIYASEKGAGINTTTVNSTENKEILKNYLDTSSNAQAQVSTSGLTTEYTYYKIDINSTNYGDASTVLYNSNTYWLASRCVSCFSGNAIFHLCRANTNIGGFYVFSSGGSASSTRYCLRPVVTLVSDVQVTPCTGTNSESNTHTINW